MSKTRGRARGERAELGHDWPGRSQEVFLGLQEWRLLHPRATLAEIETELDRRLFALRAHLLADVALASHAADLQTGTAERGERPACPACGGPLQDEGPRTRRLQTLGGAAVPLARDYATCTRCGSGTFPPG